jgi:uncharacterized protein VirK/YbjX
LTFVGRFKFRVLSQLRPGSILDTGVVLVNAMSDLPSAVAWLRFLAELERKHNLPPSPFELIAKPLQSYAAHRLTVKQRCSLLRAHYTLAGQALPPWAFGALWTGSRIPMGSLSGRKGGKYHLVLESSSYCRREGEYSVTLIAEDGFELAKLTFMLTKGVDGDGDAQLFIGGLQGATAFFGSGGKERVIAATRDLSGLRPKMAVFVAASRFAALAGASSLFAVSNRTHAINAEAWYQRRKLVADYDAFWVERGGVATGGGFAIPLNAEPRAASCAARNAQRRRAADLVDEFFRS